jgi:hypothetical protein
VHSSHGKSSLVPTGTRHITPPTHATFINSLTPCASGENHNPRPRSRPPCRRAERAARGPDEPLQARGSFEDVGASVAHEAQQPAPSIYRHATPPRSFPPISFRYLVTAPSLPCGPVHRCRPLRRAVLRGAWHVWCQSRSRSRRQGAASSTARTRAPPAAQTGGTTAVPARPAARALLLSSGRDWIHPLRRSTLAHRARAHGACRGAGRSGTGARLDEL